MNFTSFVSKVLISLCSFVACFLAVEIYFVLFPGSANQSGPKLNLSNMFEVDSELGWRNKPGTTIINDYGRTTTYSISKEGARINTVLLSKYTPETKRAVLLGDSFTFGVLLDFDLTFGGILQKKVSRLDIDNFAVGGYGTCQAYITMKRIIQNKSISNTTFIYGFSDFHEDRTIRDPRQDFEIAKNSGNSSSLYPRCHLQENNSVIIDPPKKFSPLLITMGKSHFLSMLITTIIIQSEKHIIASKRNTTMTLIEEMNQLARDNNCSFILMLQSLEAKAHQDYLAFSKSKNITLVDGNLSPFSEDLRLPDGHPNEKANEIWANALIEHFREMD